MFSTRSDSPKAPVTDPGWRQAGLLLCAHGVRGQVGVAAKHAAAIAALNEFADVEACCLHGQPSLEEALEQTSSDLSYIVPLLMAEGYTSEKLSERLVAARRYHSADIHLCRPVGSHPDLAKLMVESAERTCRAQNWPVSETALLLVGHGTTRHVKSGDSLQSHADTIAANRRFAEVGCAFLDQEPDLTAALKKTRSAQAVAVGHFADSGPHGAEDVAELLAKESREIAYAGAVGCEPGLTALILDRVRQEDAFILAA